MSPIAEELPGLQRLSLIGGVFYVHQNPAVTTTAEMTDEGPAADEADGEATTCEAAADEVPPDDDVALEDPPNDEPTDDAPVPDRADPPIGETEDGQLRAVPRGYALEFGTGRLVPLQYVPDGFVVIRSRGRGRY